MERGDPIIKERLFGLTNGEGNHGEDVKEYYFYQDSTPTHSWMRALYKYPQAAYPYEDLYTRTRGAAGTTPSTSSSTPGSSTTSATSTSRWSTPRRAPRMCWSGSPPPTAAPNRPCCTCFRPSGCATPGERRAGAAPRLTADTGARRIDVDCPELGSYALAWEDDVDVLFTENESNWARIYGGTNATLHVKDGINDAVVEGREDAVNPDLTGTKVALRRRDVIGAGESVTMRLRLATSMPETALGDDTDQVLTQRRKRRTTSTPPSRRRRSPRTRRW